MTCVKRLLEHHGRRANLMVMGPCGRPRLQEFVLGGVSCHMLAHAVVPLFVSH